MQFISIGFFAFMTAFILIYNVIPTRFRRPFLVVGNLFFYMTWAKSVTDIIPIIAITLITWICAIIIENNSSVRIRKTAVFASIAAGIGSLIYFKYAKFLIETFNSILSPIIPGGGYNGSDLNIVAPLGISFFTLQALSYVFEVYKRNVKAERNIITYAAYVTFFPTVMSGPIERPTHLLRQLKEAPHRSSFIDVKSGLLFVLYGGFVKYVAADRLALLTNTVFGSYMAYGSTELLLSAIAYSLQIYCDFYAYSTMAFGIARIMGFEVIENFNAPYFAGSIREFWRRWHVSLSTWFRDYVYIPLGGNRCSRLRKNFNLIVTFLVSGLWHGASFTYIIWGMLHGIYQVIGDLTVSLRKKFYEKFSFKTDCFSFKLGQRLFTFMLVAFAWIFFRSASVSDALNYIVRMFTQFDIWTLFDKSLYNLGLDIIQSNILIVALCLIFILDYFKYKTGKGIYKLVERQNWTFQGLVYIILFFAIFVLGTYGKAYNAQEFIYFQF